MAQLIGAIVLIIVAKLIYDIIREQLHSNKHDQPKGGEIIDLSDNWVEVSNLPYRRRDQLLNARELIVYDMVRNIIGSSPYVIYPKVRLADIIQLSADAANRQEHIQRVKERSIDLLVCQLPDLKPVLVLQVEPPAGDDKRKYRGERFIRQSLQAAGIPYLSLNPNQLPEADEIKCLLFQEDVQA